LPDALSEVEATDSGASPPAELGVLGWATPRAGPRASSGVGIGWPTKSSPARAATSG